MTILTKIFLLSKLLWQQLLDLMVKQHWGEEEEEVTLVAPLLRWR